MLIATNRSTGGMLLMLDGLRPEFARINIIVFVCAAAGVLAAVLVILLWRTWAGTILMAAVLCGYGLVLNGPGDWLSGMAPPDATRPVTTYRITLQGDIEGVDLWVNGVHLGKTPVEMDLDEFFAKVPYWPEPPKGYRDVTDEIRLSRYSVRSTHTSIRHRWIGFKLGDYVKSRDRRGHAVWERGSKKEYFARVKLAGQWGGGRGGGASSGGGRYTQLLQCTLNVDFPERQKRLEKLLDKARLMDYKVDEDWLVAIETYGRAGWKALREAAMSEPELTGVLDAWARWRYKLDDVKKASTAWRAFKRICDDADARGEYSTASVAGRAIELIVPMLDPNQLVDHAVASIKRYRHRSGGYGYRHEYGRFQFSTSTNEMHRKDLVPPNAAVVAHAVWMLDELLDEKDDWQANLVEQKVTAALIRWQPFHDSLMVACSLGGPDIERYLQRKPWRRDFPEHSRENTSRYHGNSVNKWAYLQANLSGDAGKQFRTKNEQIIRRLANKILAGVHYYNPPGFIFLETEDGGKGFAEKYWPEYRAFAAGKYGALRLQWKYLANMEPFSTVDMYIDAWLEFKDDYSNKQEALFGLDSLPPAKRQAIIDALRREVDEGPVVTDNWRGDAAGWRNYMSRQFDRHESDETVAGKLIAELRGKPAEQYLSVNIPLWLEHTRPDHPLVKMLSEAAEPALRLMVMGALAEHPTPANRAILDKLRGDGDSAVRSAAEKLYAELQAFGAKKPAAFAAD